MSNLKERARMENKSGLEPLGHAVLVRMLEASAYKGTIAIPDVVREKAAVVEVKCEVVGIGTECWNDEAKPRAMPGDWVLVTRYAGFVARGPLDGQLYRLVNDRDIFCQVAKEAE
jgi:co-chaperonin GroES (HSP10)